ncbi:MAG: adenylate/guanylate cyclase domain-containing protein [Acidobacteria bacterium]|nr:adenylate/guanylate cyclase domain-containing protein [Acidobacteriota bacterium]
MGKARNTLTELIEQRLMSGADISAIDQKIWAMFGESWAILCLDMSGFTKRTDEFGIIHFLTLIHEMQKLLSPIILSHYGFLLKTEADNIFAIFRDPVQAVRCSVAMNEATRLYNSNKSEDFQIMICVGIGYGKVIKIGDEDCYGNEVNYAFKLGEDTAKAAEILLTPDAYQAVQPQLNMLSFREKQTDKIGLVHKYYKLEY